MGHADSDEDKGPFTPGPPLPTGKSSLVRPVVLPDGTGAVLKRFRSHRAWRQAQHALLVWGPACGDELRVPRLLGSEPEGPLTLMIERLPGERADQPGWRRDPSLADALGRGLRALHAVPSDDDDPLPLDEACARRMAGWLKRAASEVEPEVLTGVNDRFQPAALRGRRRRVCHRDAEPYNVLRTPGLSIALVDFEHARMDDPLLDIVSTWDGAPLDRSPFTAGLVAAWGHAAPLPALRCWGLLHGVATLCMARSEGDTERAEQALAFLIRLNSHTPIR